MNIPIQDIINNNTVYDVFVYCGGKCGGSTLNNTFNMNGMKSFHVHGNGYIRNQLKLDMNVFDIIDFSRKNKKVYIIDSYRTPIERKISSFFQNITIHIPDYMNYSVDELINIFNDKYLMNLEEYHSINEIMRHYNISIFDKFDFNKGYIMKEVDNIVFVKILFNDIIKWETILSEIFDKKIILHSVNLTENKETGKLYKEFKSKYKVLSKYLDRMEKEDKMFRIFNTVQQQESYISYWRDNIKKID